MDSASVLSQTNLALLLFKIQIWVNSFIALIFTVHVVRHPSEIYHGELFQAECVIDNPFLSNIFSISNDKRKPDRQGGKVHVKH